MVARIDVDVKTHGLIFHPALAERVVDAGCDRVEMDVAKEGEDQVHRQLGTVLRQPTGRYYSSIDVKRDGDGVSIDGDNVIYGPWLEGVGSRNRTTRFKGYFTFRKVAQWLNAVAGHMADRQIDREVKRLS